MFSIFQVIDTRQGYIGKEKDIENSLGDQSLINQN
jgi:hypothetical protein